jgi:hypothetical protein
MNTNTFSEPNGFFLERKIGGVCKGLEKPILEQLFVRGMNMVLIMLSKTDKVK